MIDVYDALFEAEAAGAPVQRIALTARDREILGWQPETMWGKLFGVYAT